MKTPTKFVNELSNEQREELRQAMKTGNEQVRRRAHAVLLSARGYTIDQIADIYEVDRDRVSHWLDRWEDGGPTVFRIKRDVGANQPLTKKSKSRRSKLSRKTRALPNEVCRRSKKRPAKGSAVIRSNGSSRKATKLGSASDAVRRGKRDEADFKAAKAELEGFRAQAEAGKIDLYYFDEAGFTLDPCVPYAWQTVGETIEIPAASSDRINVAGLLEHRPSLSSVRL